MTPGPTDDSYNSAGRVPRDNLPQLHHDQRLHPAGVRQEAELEDNKQQVNNTDGNN